MVAAIFEVLNLDKQGTATAAAAAVPLFRGKRSRRGWLIKNSFFCSSPLLLKLIVGSTWAIPISSLPINKPRRRYCSTVHIWSWNFDRTQVCQFEMLQCLSLKTSSAASPIHSPPPTNGDYNCPPASQAGNSADGTPRSSTQPSPTVNLTREYTLAVQTNSYNEMWSRIHYDEAQIEEIHDHYNEEDGNRLFMAQVLQPNRECVEEALRHAKPNTLTQLVSTYFDHSENTTQLCILLQRSVYRARALYGPLHELLDVIPIDSESLSQSQCDCAFDVFLQFDCVDNPFPCPDSHNFNAMRQCFSQLKQQLDRRIRKSRSRIHLVRRATFGSALCVIGSVVAVVGSAVVIASHALVAIAATPICTVPYLPRRLAKKELAHVKQLDAASRGTYVLNNDLATLDRLIVRLYDAVECDKHLIRIGLERGKDLHPISEVLKLLQKNHLNFIIQLKDLEEHICLCFNAVNRARSLLLQEIHLHQISIPNNG